MNLPSSRVRASFLCDFFPLSAYVYISYSIYHSILGLCALLSFPLDFFSWWQPCLILCISCASIVTGTFRHLVNFYWINNIQLELNGVQLFYSPNSHNWLSLSSTGCPGSSKTADLVHSDIGRFISPAETLWRLFLMWRGTHFITYCLPVFLSSLPGKCSLTLVIL